MHDPRHTIRRYLAGLVVAVAVAAAASGTAEAANISKFAAMECGRGTVTTYFPDLYTAGGDATVYFTPDLYKYTSAGWQLWNGSKPWYRATVGQNGIYLINGYKWFINGTQTAARNVPFNSLSPGWYAVNGSFYNGSSHWARDWASGATSCKVT